MLIAGGENGNIILYDPAKIIAGDSEVVITQKDKHMEPVRALDFNLFQTNLVASGANESEIYIWDLNNFATPMTPGAKTQPPEDISCIAWNRQVQHILASASPSGRATVWDLRKNEPIIKVSDHSNQMRCSSSKHADLLFEDMVYNVLQFIASIHEQLMRGKTEEGSIGSVLLPKPTSLC
uniref:Protein transport protein Sec31A n=1 Tax=Sphaerodactylus townsendi TaxID=933632 RepID=A0ACB8FBF2_9SAUR